MNITAAQHTGAMVALMIPQSVADAVENSGIVGDGLDGDPLHCTLIYLGKAADLTAEQQTELLDAVEQFCAEEPPLECSFGGVLAFATNKDGTPLCGIVQCSQLDGLRYRLVERLRSIGIVSPSQFGFVPHMAVSYWKDDGWVEASRTAHQFLSTVEPFRIDRAVVALAGREFECPFGG